MKRTRRRKVTVETERLLIISHYNGAQGWCEGCSATVKMVGPEEAAAFAGLSQRAIFRLIESSQLHFTETPDGGLFICVNSLLEKPKTRAGRNNNQHR